MTTWQPYHHLTFSIPKIENPIVLGISAYFHDSGAALVKNGRLAVAVEEERFTRRKHDNHFPNSAINYCLKEAGRQPDLIVYYEDPERKFRRIETTLKNFPHSSDIEQRVRATWTCEKAKENIRKLLREVVGSDEKVIFLDHHLSHAASAYLTSGLKEAAIVTIDGVGETTSTAIGVGSDFDIEMKEKIEFPDSIGLLYSALTVFLGFKALDGEYKVMGLAAYGNGRRETNPYYRKLTQTLQSYSDGSYSLAMKYFGHDHFGCCAFTDELANLLELAPRRPEETLTQEHKDLAAATQLLTEELIYGVLNHAQQLVQSENLCFSGGVALNALANSRILANTKFKRVFVPPAAGDGGTSVGAARFVQVHADSNSRRERLRHAYLGPKYSHSEIEERLLEAGIDFEKYNNDQEIIERAAALLSSNAIVGWFWGRMEWGPRALGARSILANPTSSAMQNRLNLIIKHRESFRPFAPIVCSEDASQYFVTSKPLGELAQFMVTTLQVRENYRSRLPAVTHVDGTARVQILRREQNHLLYDLLKQFAKISGAPPVLVNTSFNVDGEPIVASPADAIRCFKRTGLDALFLERFGVINVDRSALG